MYAGIFKKSFGSLDIIIFHTRAEDGEKIDGQTDR